MTEMREQAVLEAKNLSFAYKPGEPILSDVSFCLHRGETVGIMGASGCGKTTFFYCLSGIIPKLYSGILQGEVTLLGEPIAEKTAGRISEQLGIVFQDPDSQLFSDLVLENIVFGPENLCVAPEEIRIRIQWLCERLPLELLLSQKTNALSGGQKQMVAIASVLAMKPSILFFDEALAQLDAAGRDAVYNVIAELKEDGCAIVLIDHEREHLQMADRILMMKEGGRFEERVY